jgi:hypothetical protein
MRWGTLVVGTMLGGACGGTAGAPLTNDASVPDAPSDAASLLCTPGQSIPCTGPGGCQGGQACNAQGSGYLSCDCGVAADASLDSSGSSSGSEGGTDSGSGSGGEAGTDSGSGSSSGGDSGAESGLPDSGMCPGSEVRCGGVCVDEQTNDSNCGGCGIGCSGTCSGGRCIVTLASGMGADYGIAVQGSSVYWAGGSAILTVPTVGGTVATLAPASSPQTVVTDAAHVYWTSAEMPYALEVALGGGTVSTVANLGGGSRLGGLAVDASNIYFTDFLYGYVWSTPLAGGTLTTIAYANDSAPMGIAVTASNVYWANSGSNSDSVQSAPKGVNQPALTTIATGQNTPIWVTLDSTNLDWTDENGFSVMKAPLAGGAPTILASSQNEPYGIAIDGTSVYWANQGGEVMKVPLGGGTPTTLASGQSTPMGVAVDATSVYWTNTGGGGSVMKVTPK